MIQSAKHFLLIWSSLMGSLVSGESSVINFRSNHLRKFHERHLKIRHKIDHIPNILYSFSDTHNFELTILTIKFCIVLCRPLHIKKKEGAISQGHGRNFFNNSEKKMAAITNKSECRPYFHDRVIFLRPWFDLLKVSESSILFLLFYQRYRQFKKHKYDRSFCTVAAKNKDSSHSDITNETRAPKRYEHREEERK